VKVAFLTHFYPPAPGGGAANYAARLAEGLCRAGVDCRVLCVGDWEHGAAYLNGQDDERQEGVPVRRLHVNWARAPRPFDYLFDSPPLGQAIERFLGAVRPDVVHVHSCYTLSAQALTVPQALGIPSVVHLHDMWFICPRHTLLRKDGRTCLGARGDWDCLECLLWRTRPDRWLSQLLGEGRRGRLYAGLGRCGPLTRAPGFRGMLGDMRRSRRVALNALLGSDIILAPSHALRALYERNGVPAGRIRYQPYGHATAWARSVTRQAAPRLRFAFLGNVLPIKGVHLLIDAAGLLPANLPLEVHVYGHEGDSAYAAALRARGRESVTWHGAYQAQDLAGLFAAVDVVVFPSTWHENSPLVIQEAFAAGCPVICSDVAGAREWVRDEVDGLHFHSGDAQDLARQMRRLVEEPGLLAQLREGIQPVRTVEQELPELLAIYREAVGLRSSGRTAPAEQPIPMPASVAPERSRLT
jgi:glycosyltransferase involved in cell wall biosynthesis